MNSDKLAVKLDKVDDFGQKSLTVGFSDEDRRKDYESCDWFDAFKNCWVKRNLSGD